MWFSRKQKTPANTTAQALAAGPAGRQTTTVTTTKARGDAAEQQAASYLERAGLQLVDRNFRTPGRGGGEIDLVMRARDGTLVFVEVRQRASQSHGGAGASISRSKQQRIVFAARHYLMRWATPPPCRFDVVLVHGAVRPGEPGAAGAGETSVEWLVGAFDADAP